MQQQGRQAFLVLGAASVQQFGPAMGFYLGKQLFVKHDSLAAAAAAMGVPEATLASELEAYNAAAAAGKDVFGKSVFPATVDPAAPLHVARITPVVHYTMVGCAWGGLAANWLAGQRGVSSVLPLRRPAHLSPVLAQPAPHCCQQSMLSLPSTLPLQGGVAINPEAQALDANGVPVPGLFAAGEVGGSKWGGGPGAQSRTGCSWAHVPLNAGRRGCRFSAASAALPTQSTLPPPTAPPAGGGRPARRQPPGRQLAARVRGVWAARGAQRRRICGRHAA